MLRYAVRRIFFGGIPLLIVIATITFLLMHAVPGGAWDGGRPLTPGAIANLERAAGIDQPLPQQYARFVLGLLQGELGDSLNRPGQSVAGLVRDRVGAPALLAGLALAVAVPFALVAGVTTARRPGSRFDKAAFVVAIALIVVFSVWLDLLPVSGWGRVEHVILPALSLAVLPFALLSRVTRSAVLEALAAGYVRTATAKGLPSRVVLRRHVLPNASHAPLIVLGTVAADLAAGSFLVEYLFAVPGLGRLFVDSVFQRDYGVIMGVTLFYATLILAINLMVDLAQAGLDPRIRRRLSAAGAER